MALAGLSSLTGALTENKISSYERQRTQEQYERLLSILPVAEPTSLVLGLVTREDLEGSLATCEITRETIPKADQEVDDLYGTLYSAMMGPSGRNKRCGYCAQFGDNCPGHPGKIMFYRTVCDQLVPNPIFHPSYVKLIVQCLQATCARCGGLILRDVIKSRGLTGNLKLIAKESIDKDCMSCHRGTNPLYKIASQDKNVINRRYDKEGQEFAIQPKEVYNILSGLSLEDEKLLGFHPAGQRSLSNTKQNRPRDFIQFGMLVMPPNKRPIKYVDGVPQEHDFTKHLLNIVKKSNNLRTYKPPPEYTAEKIERDILLRTRDLMTAYRDMIEKQSASKRSNETVETIKSELNSKAGLFRSDVNATNSGMNTARTVIGPGPDIRADQIGLPEEWRSELYQEERVFRTIDVKGTVVSNLDRLTALMQKGEIMRIIRGTKTISINEVNKNHEQLQIGDVIHRFMQNGDYSIVGRNPSLHEHSAKALKASFTKSKTIKVNLSLLGGYAGDFDGDEGNVIVPTSLHAQAEMMTLNDPANCLMSRAKGGVVIGAIIDTLTGTYLLTRPDTILDRDSFFQATFKSGIEIDFNEFFYRARDQGIEAFSGRALFSSLLPSDFNFEDSMTTGIEVTYVDTNGRPTITKKENRVIIRDGVMVSGLIQGKHIGANGSLANFIVQKYGGKRYIDFISQIQFLANWFLSYHGFTLELKDCINLDDSGVTRDRIQQIIQESFVKLEKYREVKTGDIEENRRQQEYVGNLSQISEMIMTEAYETYSKSNMAIMANSGAKGNQANASMMTQVVGMQTMRGQMLPKSLGEGERARVTPFFPHGCKDPRAEGYCIENFGLGISVSATAQHSSSTRMDVAAGKVYTGKYGYIQRKLMKALENAIIANSGLVIDIESIIQFVAYDVGIDPGQLIVCKDDYGKFYSYIDMSNFVMGINRNYRNSPIEFLSQDQINQIVSLVNESRIVFSPITTTNNNIVKNNRSLLARQLRAVKVADTPEARLKLKEVIATRLRRSWAEPGTTIGTVAATSIGEIITQLNLKLKTLVGTGSSQISNDRLGSISTLLNTPKEPTNRSSFIYFDPPVTFSEIHRRIKDFERILVGKLLSKVDVYNAGALDRSWYQNYINIIDPNQQIPPEQANALRFEFNLQVLYNYDITLSDIHAILAPLRAVVFYSPNHLGIIDVYRSSSSIEDDSIFLRDVVMPDILKMPIGGIPGISACYPSTIPLMSIIQTEREVAPGQWLLTSNKEVQRGQPISIQMLIPHLVRNGFNVIDEVENNQLRISRSGTGEGPRVILQQEANNPDLYDLYNISYLETNGTNLSQILLIPGVDQRYTYSNHSVEMQSIFGIESAKDMFLSVLNVNLGAIIPVHTQLLGDYMHYSGLPSPLSFSGLAGRKLGTDLMAFERTLDALMNAAHHNIPESVKSINVSNFIGLYGNFGTGMNKIVTPQDVQSRIDANNKIVSSGGIPYKERISSTAEEELEMISALGGEKLNILPDVPSSSIFTMPLFNPIQPKVPSITAPLTIESKNPPLNPVPITVNLPTKPTFAPIRLAVAPLASTLRTMPVATMQNIGALPIIPTNAILTGAGTPVMPPLNPGFITPQTTVINLNPALAIPTWEVGTGGPGSLPPPAPRAPTGRPTGGLAGALMARRR